MDEPETPRTDGAAMPEKLTDGHRHPPAEDMHIAGADIGEHSRRAVVSSLLRPVIFPYGRGGPLASSFAVMPRNDAPAADDDAWDEPRHRDGEPDRGFTQDDLRAQEADERGPAGNATPAVSRMRPPDPSMGRHSRGPDPEYRRAEVDLERGHDGA